MRLPPRLAISLPLSVLFLAARLAGAEAVAAALAAGLIGAMAAPASGAAGIAATATLAAGGGLLWAGAAGGTASMLAALPLAGNLALAWHFGSTLGPGREPLITRYTRADFGHVPEMLVGYTRRLTLAWTAFFLVFSALNALTLAGLGPPAGPSAAANLVLSAAFFLGEHGLRAMLFPSLGPVGPARTLRAIWRADVATHAR